MKTRIPGWIKPTVTILTLSVLRWLAPVAPLDPWHLLSPQKIITMILALAVIQVLGSTMAHYLGARTGAVLTGIFGGFISSTATTASLARKSKINDQRHSPSLEEGLTYLAATGAMLFEGVALVITGTSDVHFANLLIFIGPIFMTLALGFAQYRKLTVPSASSQNTTTFMILPLLMLSVFIVGILSLSRIAQNLFGQNGLLVVTSLVSLFEIHGSIIANVQLHELEVVSVRSLSSLLTISVGASYLSKLFLIWTLGSSQLKSYAFKSTLLLFGSLALSWMISMSLA